MIDESLLRGDLAHLLKRTEDNIRARCEESADVDQPLQERYDAARSAGRTGTTFQAWREGEITQAAQRDLDNATRMKAESHRQVDLYIEQGKATAEERSGAVWNEAQGRIQEVRLERARVEDKRRALLADLSHVRGTVQDLEHHLGTNGAPEA